MSMTRTEAIRQLETPRCPYFGAHMDESKR